MVLAELIGLRASGRSPGGTGSTKRGREVTEEPPRETKGKRSSAGGTDGREFLPQPSDAVGKRPRRNVKPPEVYKDEFFTKKNKRGEKPVPSSLVEESEATLPSSLEENLSGAPKAKGKPGRNPSKQGRKPKAQQSSQLENEVPSSDVETEMFEPHEPTAKPSTKKGRKAATQPSRSGHTKKQKAINGLESGKALPATFQVDANANGLTDSATSPRAELAAVTREEVLVEPEEAAGVNMSIGVPLEREASDSRLNAFAREKLESGFRSSGPRTLHSLGMSSALLQGSTQEDGVSNNAVHPEEAALNSLASVASGNEIFVAREAARVNSPAAVEGSIAAAEEARNCASPQDSSEAFAIAAAKADHANVSHPSTPSPTEETAHEQDHAAAEPLLTLLLEEAAQVVQEAVKEAVQTAQEATQEVQEAAQQAMREPVIEVGPAQQETIESQPPAQEPCDLAEAATDISLAGQPVIEHTVPAAVISEAEKPLRSPKGMLTEAAALLRSHDDIPAELDNQEQASDSAVGEAAVPSSAERLIHKDIAPLLYIDPEVEGGVREAEQRPVSLGLPEPCEDRNAAASEDAAASLAGVSPSQAEAIAETVAEMAADLEAITQGAGAPKNQANTQQETSAAGASALNSAERLQEVLHAPDLMAGQTVGDGATQTGAEVPISLALALVSQQPISGNITQAAPKFRRKKPFLPVKPYQLKRLTKLKSGTLYFHKATQRMYSRRQLLLDMKKAEYGFKCEQHQSLSAQLQEVLEGKLNTSGHEAAVKNDLTTRKQERRRERLEALNYETSILEEEDDDALMLSHMEADKGMEEAAQREQHNLRLLDQGAEPALTMNGHLDSASPAVHQYSSTLPETPSASEDSLMIDEADCNEDAAYSGATKLSLATLNEVDWPAIWSHPAAWQAFQSVVKDHVSRTKIAWKYGMCPALGRDLAGYAARCGDIADSDSVIRFGCGTSLADVHYHCAHCVEAAGEAEEEGAEDDGRASGAAAAIEEERHTKDPGPCQEEVSATSNDYCEKCMRESKGACPNPNCLSRGTDDHQLMPMDFLRVPHISASKDFCSQSKALYDHCQDLAEQVTRHNHKVLKRAKKGLSSECFVINGGRCPMYEANVEVVKRHLLFRNGLDEGVPVLMKECGHHFDPEPFSAEGMQELAMEDLAEKSSEEKWKVKAQFDAHGGETIKIDDLSVTDFFKPMLRGADVARNPADPEILVEGSSSNLSGFKLPDFGNLPPKQCTAFFKGLENLGIGETARLDGTQNLAFYLRAEEQDSVNGTRRPDLGPKFYIARPKLAGKKLRRYEGMTFTPLHCDLADAVNFSCSGEEATWHMFHRNDRAKLMKFLQKHYGSEKTQGVDLLWNPTNHRVLDEQDFKVLREVYAVHPWEFIQRAGEVVVIPAGCAHQVVNGSNGHNIKVAQDFVAPESAAVSLELLDEMRRAKQEDKVQAVLTLRFAGADGYQQILADLATRGVALQEEDSALDA